MTEPSDSRVAVYIDFDNIVVSRYNQLYGRSAFQQDRIRNFDSKSPDADPEIAAKLATATVDFDAILDFATSYGNTVISRGYADWSVPVNASYQRQLMDRSVDLTQLFTTTTRGTKNGADIRLAVDVMEDLFRLDDLTHIVIVAGDSDYIALAQKCQRLGRFVVGIGVAGSTSRSLKSACDDFEDYDDLPGVKAAAARTPVAEPVEAPVPEKKAPARSRRVTIPQFSDAPDQPEFLIDEPELPDPQRAATDLLVRALGVGHAKNDSEDSLHSAAVKNQMKRMDPSFNEKSLGYRSFTDFIKSRDAVAELEEDGQIRRIRLR
jgi:uncharacterized LabA/DUF88 family protein